MIKTPNPSRQAADEEIPTFNENEDPEEDKKFGLQNTVGALLAKVRPFPISFSLVMLPIWSTALFLPLIHPARTRLQSTSLKEKEQKEKESRPLMQRERRRRLTR